MLKKKGDGKGKKEKKEKSKSESIVAEAEANSNLWEARLEAAEKLKQEYKENARKLLMENHALQTKMQQTEWETIDVIAFLKKQDAEREANMEKLQKQVTDLKTHQQQKVESLTMNFHQRINDLEDKLNAKRKEAEVYHNELTLVQEFRKKRCEMENEIEDLKLTIDKTIANHQNDLVQCEKKFLEEKYKIQQESSQKIAELAEKAHQEAILNLNDTTKLVYKENVRLTEALKFHMEETDCLRKAKDIFVKEQEDLSGMMNDQNILLHKKVIETQKLKTINSKMSLKIEVLESSLRHMMKEFENQRETCMKESNQEIELQKSEIERLKQILDLKTKEMIKVKRLARGILEQRTELETFFIEAINYVRNEIMNNRKNYIYESKIIYNEKMLQALMCRTKYPRVRTFNNSVHSMNDVNDDFEAAENFSKPEKEISISELTWEQKERVLRFIFAKMNGCDYKISNPEKIALPALNSNEMFRITDSKSQPAQETFLTQNKMSHDMISAS